MAREVRLATSAADHQPGESEQLEALEDLKQIPADAARDPDFLELLERDLKPFVGKVRSDVKEEVPLLTMARAGELTALVEQVGRVARAAGEGNKR